MIAVDPIVADLIRIREQAGLTKADIAKRLGVSAAAVHAIEAGRSNPTLSTLLRYATAYGARLRVEAGQP